ncbi:hypothetical protein B0H19DRAFT_1061565 [Mycena capillaripes]|nr:hypothetical protein B0H19DRAFT_1061565 [Mycena capillaripes]
MTKSTDLEERSGDPENNISHLKGSSMAFVGASSARNTELAREKLTRCAASQSVYQFASQDIKLMGIIRPEIRTTCIRDIVTEGIAMEKVSGVIHAVAEALNVDLEGEAHSRSVERIVLEGGGIAAQLQIVDEIQNTQHVIISGDGTTHQYLNYESCHMALDVPKYRDSSAPKTEAKIHTVFQPARTTNSRRLSQTLRKSHGDDNPDNANDQKKMRNLWRGGVHDPPPDELLDLIYKFTDKKFADAGGRATCDVLSNSMLSCVVSMARRNSRLSHQSKSGHVNSLACSGCCMHKDMNVQRDKAFSQRQISESLNREVAMSHREPPGGSEGMWCRVATTFGLNALYWSAKVISSVLGEYINDSSVYSRLFAVVDPTSQAWVCMGVKRLEGEKRAEAVSSRAGVKLTELMGILLNHKNKKKGGIGDIRGAFWRGENSTLEFINGKQQYMRNGTQDFVDTKLQSDEAHGFLRKTARDVLAEKHPKKRRLERAEADEATVVEHRTKKKKSDNKKHCVQGAPRLSLARTYTILGKLSVGLCRPQSRSSLNAVKAAEKQKFDKFNLIFDIDAFRDPERVLFVR